MMKSGAIRFPLKGKSMHDLCEHAFVCVYVCMYDCRVPLYVVVYVVCYDAAAYFFLFVLLCFIGYWTVLHIVLCFISRSI